MAKVEKNAAQVPIEDETAVRVRDVTRDEENNCVDIETITPIFNDSHEANFLVTKDPAIQQDRIMKLEQQLKNLTADNAYLSSMLDQTIIRQADHNRRLQRQCDILEPKVTN